MRLAIALLLLPLLAGLTFGQGHSELLMKVSKIKLLESTQSDVQRIFAEYNTPGIDGHFQRYYNDAVDIRVYFSDGTCTDDPEENDASLVWKVEEWKVTRIEIEPSEKISIKDSGYDLSKFGKEELYRESPEDYIYHDKARGLAIETGEDRVNEIIFFPPISSSKYLCEESTAVKNFYSHESWFDRKLDDRFCCILVNKPAHVEDMVLSKSVVQATTGQKISVKTIGIDPENDVLTYNYTVTAGKIVGNGANVVWDLAGVPAGSYTITVGVDDGAGIVGRTGTKTVTVK